jgi:hypothetical protein
MIFWGRVLCAEIREGPECIDLPMPVKDFTSIAHTPKGIKYRLAADQPGGAVCVTCKECTRYDVQHAS